MRDLKIALVIAIALWLLHHGTITGGIAAPDLVCGTPSADLGYPCHHPEAVLSPRHPWIQRQPPNGASRLRRDGPAKVTQTPGRGARTSSTGGVN